ncbi:MAG: triose-phosphate isomerase [Candidatus Pacearchaeota archaeon]
MIVINFKNYKVGEKSLELAKKIEKFFPKAIVSVPSINAQKIKDKTKLEVYLQHIDFHEKGKSSGFLIPEASKSIGIEGSLLNHSEHRLKSKEIKKTIKRANKNKLKIILCVKSIREARKYKKEKPFAIAFEDPKLISTGKSITKYKSKELLKFISLFKKSKILPFCGAGISSNEDYIEALKMGCKGVLISSAIANSKNPENFLKRIV